MNAFFPKSTFFNSSSYFIDEKVNFFKFENSYSVFDDKGVVIGAVKQKLSLGQKFLRILFNKKMLPFLLEIKNADDDLEASISRGWTFFLSKIEVKNPNGEVIGIIKQKFRLLKAKFVICDVNGKPLAEIIGDWSAWDFIIQDLGENRIGTITKKWAGAMKEIFTSADKYLVELDPPCKNLEQRAVILSAAITIDMILKES